MTPSLRGERRALNKFSSCAPKNLENPGYIHFEKQAHLYPVGSTSLSGDHAPPPKWGGQENSLLQGLPRAALKKFSPYRAKFCGADPFPHRLKKGDPFRVKKFGEN